MKLRHYLANIFVTASLCVLLSAPSVQASAIYQTVITAVSATFSDGITIANNKYLKMRNSSGTAVDVLAISSGNNTVLNANSGNEIQLRNAGTQIAGFSGAGDLSFQDSGTAPAATIYTNTSDADDDGQITINGGGSVTGTSSRGAYVVLQGNEASGGGDLSLNSGNSSGSTVQVSANAGTGYIDLNTGGGVNAVRIQDDGDIEMQVTGKGIILRSPDGSDPYCVVDNSDVFTCTGL